MLLSPGRERASVMRNAGGRTLVAESWFGQTAPAPTVPERAEQKVASTASDSHNDAGACSLAFQNIAGRRLCRRRPTGSADQTRHERQDSNDFASPQMTEHNTARVPSGLGDWTRSISSTARPVESRLLRADSPNSANSASAIRTGPRHLPKLAQETAPACLRPHSHLHASIAILTRPDNDTQRILSQHRQAVVEPRNKGVGTSPTSHNYSSHNAASRWPPWPL